MKKLLLGFASFCLIFSLASCGGEKKVASGQPEPMDEKEVEVNLYCSEYAHSDAEHFRAHAIGESRDPMIAKKKAQSNAKAELAATIQTKIKGVVDNYVNSREFNNKEEVEERFESLTREVINQTLSGITVKCEKMTKTSGGKYKSYLALEMAKDEMLKACTDKLSRDQRLKVDYDYEKFKQAFNEEMDKFEKE